MANALEGMRNVIEQENASSLDALFQINFTLEGIESALGEIAHEMRTARLS